MESLQRSIIAETTAQFGRESLTCGLFLNYKSGLDSLALWLRIPSVELGSAATGCLVIQSDQGRRPYQADDLHIARLVPLTPQFPLATCTGSGDLLPLATYLSEQLSAFAGDRNIFYAEEKGGRYVFCNEPLELGTRYRLLARSLIELPPDLGVALDWKAGQKIGEWHSYEVELPLAFDTSSSQLATQIAEFFGRKISSARPRLFVVEPLPHHIESDGTHVYPEAPETIFLRRSALGRVSAYVESNSMKVEVSEVADEWVQLKGLPIGGQDCTVSIAGNEQVVFRVEDCALFQPPGLVVTAGDTVWDLHAEVPIAPAELLYGDVRVECGSERVAVHIARKNSEWRQEGVVLFSGSGITKKLHAGSFGELLDIVFVSPLQENLSQSRPRIATRLWVENLVAKKFGREGLNHVRSYFSDPCHANLYRLGRIMTSSLMPYIRAAQEQERRD
ncbi:MAG: hypothetical protein FWD67_09950 [Betaproteobacteria bacterium]|nr:hypothetical protein [Betaproteobacteria bacterium]